jgi:hypothetical protein
MEFPNRENGPYVGILVRGSNKDLEKRNLLDTSGKNNQCGSLHSLTHLHFRVYFAFFDVYLPFLV